MDPKSYQLHHYTRDFKTLLLILKKDGGFWPRYSLEDFSWSQPNGKPHYLAFPCTCFCDLPFEANSMHRADYGSYIISFSKSSKLAKNLTPLIYINEDGPLAETIRAKYSDCLSHFERIENISDKKFHFLPTALAPDALQGIWDFLPYLKSTLGYTLQRRPPPENGIEYDKLKDYDYLWMTKYLEEEFEWRYVPIKHRAALYCFDDYDRWSIDRLSDLSQKTKDSFLKFSHDEVEAIVVATDAERKELLVIHPDLSNKVKIWTEIPEAADDAD